MPIDHIAQMVATQVAPTAKPAPAGTSAPAAGARQELPGNGQAASAPKLDDVRQAMSRIQDFVQNQRRDLQFRVDEDLGEVVVTVLDSESGEVIRQIPSEEVLAVAKNLEQMGRGVLLNQQA